ncbi:MAG: M3 family metallopeptidase [Luteibaculaceae bacterium]
MNVTKSAFAIGLCAILASCGGNNNESKENMERENPFFGTYDTPFNVPPFHLIFNHHFKPALQEGMKQHQAEIDAIVNNTDAPTFENTIVAYDNAGDLLGRVSSVFYNLNSANTSDELQAIANEMAPEISKHYTNISLNEGLFERVKTVYNQKDGLGLNTEQAKLLDDMYKGFVRNGANLNEEQKERLREINSQESQLTLKFGQNQLAETNAYQLVIENEADLAGLPDNIIEAAKDAALKRGIENAWVFTLQNPSVMPFLTYADNRELRKEIWEAYKNRGLNDNDKNNNDIINQLVALRAEKAALLGYGNHAEFVLEKRMAENPTNVMRFLNQLWTPALAKAKVEAAEINELIRKEGNSFTLEPYDWRYYAEKIRKEKFDLDDQEVMPYFSLDNVTEGIFMVSNKLFGLSFTKIEGLPVYHPEAFAYEVTDADGSHVGVLYMDMHPRESKRGGAWMTSYRRQQMDSEGNRIAPVISIVCNFSRPTANAPALFTFDEVTTFFHEIGHALHGLLSNVTYKSQAGTSVPTDFVELPSQIMENWATDPAVLKMYAKHYETGAVIPDALIEKLERSGTFGQGFATVEYLASAFLDMDYHTRTEGLDLPVKEFEKRSMDKIGLISGIIPRHSSAYFGHIFAGGYSAGYYSYIWSGVLDTDAFAAFKETDLFNPEKASAFRKEILERGGTDNPMDMYVRFRGAEPTIDALLAKRGLQTEKKAKR